MWLKAYPAAIAKNMLKYLTLLVVMACAIGCPAQNNTTFGTITAASTTCTPTSCVFFQVPANTPWVSLNISGTWTGSLQVKTVSDPSATYQTLNSYPATLISTITANSNESVAVGSARFVLVSASVLTAGPVQVSMSGSQSGTPLSNPVFAGYLTTLGIKAPDGGNPAECWATDGSEEACSGGGGGTYTAGLGIGISGSNVISNLGNTDINVVTDLGIDDTGTTEVGAALSAAIMAGGSNKTYYFPCRTGGGQYKVDSGVYIGATSTTMQNIKLVGGCPKGIVFNGNASIAPTTLNPSPQDILWFDSVTPGTTNYGGPDIENITFNDTSNAGAIESGLRVTQYNQFIFDNLFYTNMLGKYYQTGTVTVTNGSTSVTCSGCNWNSSMNYGYLWVNDQYQEVNAVTGSNSATLTMPWQYPSAANVSYSFDSYGLGLMLEGDSGYGFTQYGVVNNMNATVLRVGVDAVGGTTGSQGTSRVQFNGGYINPGRASGQAACALASPSGVCPNSVVAHLGQFSDTFTWNVASNNAAVGINIEGGHAHKIYGQVENTGAYTPVNTCNSGAPSQSCVFGNIINTDTIGHAQGNQLHNYVFNVGVADYVVNTNVQQYKFSDQQLSTGNLYQYSLAGSLYGGTLGTSACPNTDTYGTIENSFCTAFQSPPTLTLPISSLSGALGNVTTPLNGYPWLTNVGVTSGSSGAVTVKNQAGSTGTGVILTAQDVTGTEQPFAAVTPTALFGVYGSGNASLASLQQAISGTNYNSPKFTWQANIWNGSASVSDTFGFLNSAGSGTNPTETFQLTHSGSSGLAVFDMSLLNQLNFPSATFATNGTNNTGNTGLNLTAGCGVLPANYSGRNVNFGIVGCATGLTWASTLTLNPNYLVNKFSVAGGTTLVIPSGTSDGQQLTVVTSQTSSGFAITCPSNMLNCHFNTTSGVTDSETFTYSTATNQWVTSAPGQFALTTTGTSGAATYTGGTLNIPQYTGGGGGSGSVTSVAFTAPSWLTVAGGPITTSGTLAMTPTTGQSSHQVIGTCGTGTTFTPCALQPSDIPTLPYLPSTGGTLSNLTVTTALAAADVLAASPRFDVRSPLTVSLGGCANVADPTNTNDSTCAINYGFTYQRAKAASQSSGSIVIQPSCVAVPPGQYKVSGTILMYQGECLVGDGSKIATVLQQTDPNKPLILYQQTLITTDAQAPYGLIQNIAMIGSGKLTKGNLLEVNADYLVTRDTVQYNTGGRGTQSNGGERHVFYNPSIYAVRWPLVYAGDDNESTLFNLQGLGNGQTVDTVSGAGYPQYCYSENCTAGAFPLPNLGGSGAPTPLVVPSRGAVHNEKSVGIQSIGGDLKGNTFLAAWKDVAGLDENVTTTYCEAPDTGLAWPVMTPCYILGGNAEKTTITSALTSGSYTAPPLQGGGSVPIYTFTVANNDWMPTHYGSLAILEAANQQNYNPMVVIPADYNQNSTAASTACSGLLKNQFEVMSDVMYYDNSGTASAVAFGSGRNGNGVYNSSTNPRGVTANYAWGSCATPPIIEDYAGTGQATMAFENLHSNTVQGGTLTGTSAVPTITQGGYVYAGQMGTEHSPGEGLIGQASDDGVGFFSKSGVANDPLANTAMDELTIRRPVSMFNSSSNPYTGQMTVVRNSYVTIEGGYLSPDSTTNEPYALAMTPASTNQVSITNLTGGSNLVAAANGAATPVPVKVELHAPAVGETWNNVAGIFQRDSAYFDNYQQAGPYTYGLQFQNDYRIYPSFGGANTRPNIALHVHGNPASDTAYVSVEYGRDTNSTWQTAFKVTAGGAASSVPFSANSGLSVNGNATISGNISAANLGAATNSAPGIVQCDGTTLNCSGGVASVIGGGSAGNISGLITPGSNVAFGGSGTSVSPYVVTATAAATATSFAKDVTTQEGSNNLDNTGSSDNYTKLTAIYSGLSSSSPNELRFPVGTYNFGTMPSTTKPVKIVCEGNPGSPGANGTLLVGTGTMDAVLGFTATSPTSASQTNGLDIENCNFGRTSANVKAGIKITEVENVRLVNNVTTGFLSTDYNTGTATMTTGSVTVNFTSASIPTTTNGFISFNGYLVETISCSNSAQTCTMPIAWQGATATGSYTLNVGGFGLWAALPASSTSTVFNQYWYISNPNGQNNSVDMYFASGPYCPTTNSSLGNSRFNIFGGRFNNKTSDSIGIYAGCWSDTMAVFGTAVNNATHGFYVLGGHANIFKGTSFENNNPGSYVSGSSTCPTSLVISSGPSAGTYSGINSRTCSKNLVLGGFSAYSSDDNQFDSPYCNQVGTCVQVEPGPGLTSGGTNAPRKTIITFPRVSNGGDSSGNGAYAIDGAASGALGTTYQDYQTFCHGKTSVAGFTGACP